MGFFLLQIETSVNDYLLDLVDDADKNKDGKIDFEEWQTMGLCLSISTHDHI
jgi:hypothetical protein